MPTSVASATVPAATRYARMRRREVRDIRTTVPRLGDAFAFVHFPDREIQSLRGIRGDAFAFRAPASSAEEVRESVRKQPCVFVTGRGAVWRKKRKRPQPSPRFREGSRSDLVIKAKASLIDARSHAELPL